MLFALIFIFFQTSFGAPSEAPASKSIASYNPEALLLKILNFNKTEPRARYGLQNFENDQYQDYVNGDYNSQKVKFDDYTEENAQELNHNLGFQYGLNHDLTKRRPKRRKPKQSYNGVHYPGPQYGGVAQSFYPYMAVQQNAPSLASSALSSVTRALASIAKYDERQCVARMVCEAAAGAVPASLLDRVSGLQPLFTLLTAYSGLSSAPLLVFGRAALLGASGSSAGCRYAHPQCPTDTEELVHYLNNHNGGFFRFFNAPEQEQNIEQLHNQLHQNLHHSNQHYGLYNGHQQNRLYRPSLYPADHQYGFAFPYNDHQYSGYQIENRIQNKPIGEEDSLEHTNKWTFPDLENDYISNNDINYVKNYQLTFPEDAHGQNNFRKTRGFSFPNDYDHFKTTNERFVYVNNKPIYNKFSYDNNNNEPAYNRFSNYNDNRDVSNEFQTVYVVRGNGDPNKPEIIHLRPGETVH